MTRKLLWLLVLTLVLTLSLAACGGDKEEETAEQPATVAQGNPENGKVVFATTCAACHGPAGEGVPNLGKDMTTSEFIAGKTDAELAAFIKVGRAPDDPLNTTGVLMPPKGGNPALSDEQLADIIAYIRTIHR